MSQIIIRIIYDNQKENPNMQEGWGFSCLVEVGHRKILFDTGADMKAFFANLQQMEIPLTEITDVFFSHKHSDHVAGLQEIMSNMRSEVRLFLPKGFPSLQLLETVVDRKFRRFSGLFWPLFDSKLGGNIDKSILPPNFEVENRLKRTRKSTEISINDSLLARTIYVSDFFEVDSHVFSLVLKGGFRLYEQALILRSGKGLVVITGCAHPGIGSIVETVQKRFGEPIHLVLGGFHLFRKNRKSIGKIVDQFKSLQVEKAAPCHCSGDVAIAEFQNAYQENFCRIGTGTVLRLDSW